MWRTLIASVIWMSAFTNCMITGFTSQQLTHYLPELYLPGKLDGIVVFVIFGLERVLLFLGLLVYAIVPAVPEDISEQLERCQYIRLKQDAMTKEKKTS
jgi:hypothetical protein